MLKKLRLHNFRTYLNAEFEPTQRHLLIGANNSGKTNLCAALRFLSATASNDLTTSAQIVPGGPSELKNWAFDSTTVDFACVCEVPFAGQTLECTYGLTIKAESAPKEQGRTVFRVKREDLAVKGPGIGNAMLLTNDGHEAHMLHEGSQDGFTVKTLAPRDATMLSKLYELENNQRAIAFRRYLGSWLYFALSPEAMRLGWQTARSIGVLSARGDELAAYLFRLKNIDERRYRRVIEHVRLIEPDLEFINFLVTSDQWVPFVDLKKHPGASWLGLSDGTLRALALSAVAETVGIRAGLGEVQPSPLAIIEEPENGIYPGQLRRIFELFEERAPEGQFLFTSHSPYFINFFDGNRESVTLLRRSNERTEILKVPPADDDPDRLMLAEQYSMELFD